MTEQGVHATQEGLESSAEHREESHREEESASDLGQVLYRVGFESVGE